MSKLKLIFAFLLFAATSCKVGNSDMDFSEQKRDKNPRKVVLLDQNWKTAREGSEILEDTSGIEKFNYDDSAWQNVDIPHNWDQYYGYRRMKHGNLHGTAWYRKEFSIDPGMKGRRYFLFFEGVGSYAIVWVNGKLVGTHKGGRTSFTLDITDAIDSEKKNVITVKAGHPAFIADLPWVCGGCSGEWGFSEGSQPMGIFRPVSLIATNDIKIEPFGVHVWNDNTISSEKASLYIETELKNYSQSSGDIEIVSRLIDKQNNAVAEVSNNYSLSGLSHKTYKQNFPEIKNPHLWSPEDPYLYNLVSLVKKDGKVIDKLETPYGIRWISFPIQRQDGDPRFYLNGKPYFINGTCEYEHLIGKSHSFTNEMIGARISQIISGGFNAFREAHQPHNLSYQHYLDEKGMLFWSQFSAHIWYDTPEFKENFKILLKDWIKERRNSPSIIMWGLQNESTIPEAFAKECTAIIREMDPTASSQRPVTTCNGGSGTDWNVIQNWSGTYGGDPYNYGKELKKDLLNGEYGAWRTTDLHTDGPFDQDGKYSENRFSQLMEIKAGEATNVKDSVIGHFNWLFSSHENPGRIQNGEGFRDIDRIGPVNYKGLFTAWGEPLDAYYMYRSNYASKSKEPMVYIVSHSWPERWLNPGIKDSIVVYSNCDEVELMNDMDGKSFGRKKNPGTGKHFQWDGIDIQYNLLKAKGYVNGEAVATDVVVLNNLPESPNFQKLYTKKEVLAPQDGNYIYRVNAGGPEFIDSFGNSWAADVHKSNGDSWGSLSWTDNFDSLPDFYASQRRIWDPVKDTKNWSLFQTFRYGTDQLQYEFPVENGEYKVDLYFVEPWYGTGGGLDCSNWRIFDIAINNKTVLKNFDIWKEAGYDTAIKKTFTAQVVDKKLIISFPEERSGQAIISAVAIRGKKQEPAEASRGIIKNTSSTILKKKTWLDIGQKEYTDAKTEWAKLPYQVFGAEWLSYPENNKFSGSIELNEKASVYVLSNDGSLKKPEWLQSFTKIEGEAVNSLNEHYKVYLDTLEAKQSLNFNNSDGTEFFVAAVPYYRMGEGEDERPSIKFEAEKAHYEAEKTSNFKDADYVDFGNKSPAIIEWEVNPGLAGIHLLRFRYMNVSTKPIKVKFEIIAANGTIIRNDELTFPVKDEKWKILNTTTGGYINAGKYKIRISGSDLNGLRLESFEFQ